MSRSSIDSENDTGMLSFEQRRYDDGAVRSGSGSIELTVQGQPLIYDGARDVRSVLEAHGENSAYANVRINGDVLRRRDFENIPVRDGDNIDFLYFMGGGR